ncbi:hypothetical protein SCA6_004778 [Theobroma cacao]
MLHIDLVQKLVTRLEICHCFPLCILYIAQRPQNARWIDHSHINKLRWIGLDCGMLWQVQADRTWCLFEKYVIG